MRGENIVTVKELVENSIRTLGGVRPRVDDWESVGVPVKIVLDNLIALNKFFDEQEQKMKEKEEKKTEEEEI